MAIAAGAGADAATGAAGAKGSTTACGAAAGAGLATGSPPRRSMSMFPASGAGDPARTLAGAASCGACPVRQGAWGRRGR